MAKSREVPQGIKATVLGFPKRYSGGQLLYGRERNPLLQAYSDSQLDRLEKRLSASKRRLNMLTVGAAAVSLLSYTAINYLAIVGVEEVRNSLPLDPLASTLYAGYHPAYDFLHHVGTPGGIDTLTIYGSTIIAPAAIAATAHGISDARGSQMYAVESEKTRRELEKLFRQRTQKTDQAKVATPSIPSVV